VGKSCVSLVTAMIGDPKQIRKSASEGEVEAFLRQMAKTSVRATGGCARLIFAMDATASRKPTWDRAARIQATMFSESAELGSLEIQLCYYSGILGFECSPWYKEASALRTCMTAVSCAAGLSQIGRVLQHAEAESRRGRVNALVFVGDCVEENPDELAGLAGRLGLLGLPAFVFQEGADPEAEHNFCRIARLSGGAYCRFDESSPQTLRDLLSAVAIYAAGGRTALEDFGNKRGGAALRLAHQIVKT